MQTEKSRCALVNVPSITVKQCYDSFRMSFESHNKPRIILRTGDMFEIAKDYHNPVIHNFANNEKPGGPLAVFTEEGKFVSIKEINNSQEEQIIKRYRNKISLPRSFYPIITKDNVSLLYSTCQDMVPVISLPFIVKRSLKKHQVVDSMLKRIELLMYNCCLNNHTLITGFWEFSSTGIKPEELYELWSIALSENYYKPIDIVFVINQDTYTNKHTDLFEMFSKLNY